MRNRLTLLNCHGQKCIWQFFSYYSDFAKGFRIYITKCYWLLLYKFTQLPRKSNVDVKNARFPFCISSNASLEEEVLYPLSFILATTFLMIGLVEVYSNWLFRWQDNQAKSYFDLQNAENSTIKGAKSNVWGLKEPTHWVYVGFKQVVSKGCSKVCCIWVHYKYQKGPPRKGQDLRRKASTRLLLNKSI